MILLKSAECRRLPQEEFGFENWSLTFRCFDGTGGNKDGVGGDSLGLDVDPADVALPLAETATIKGLTNFPAGSESEPNNRTIFKRLEEQTNVHVEWRSIQNDQWGDTIKLEMSNAKTLPDFVFNAGFGEPTCSNTANRA